MLPQTATAAQTTWRAHVMCIAPQQMLGALLVSSTCVAPSTPPACLAPLGCQGNPCPPSSAPCNPGREVSTVPLAVGRPSSCAAACEASPPAGAAAAAAGCCPCGGGLAAASAAVYTGALHATHWRWRWGSRISGAVHLKGGQQAAEEGWEEGCYNAEDACSC
jgi:hypothetical protein